MHNKYFDLQNIVSNSNFQIFLTFQESRTFAEPCGVFSNTALNKLQELVMGVSQT